MYDNIWRAKAMIFGEKKYLDQQQAHVLSLEEKLKSKNSENTQVIPLFDSIIQLAVEKSKLADNIPSPISMLQKIVQEKCKVRVLVRRKKGYCYLPFNHCNCVVIYCSF